MAEKCSFINNRLVLVSICGVDYSVDDLAEPIKTDEVEAITATRNFAGTTYSAANNTDYSITISANKGSELHKALEKMFQNRTCCDVSILDYNPSNNEGIVCDSAICLKRSGIEFGSSEGVSFTLDGRWFVL